jgi:ubiquitin-protein ligase E3 B
LVANDAEGGVGGISNRFTNLFKGRSKKKQARGTLPTASTCFNMLKLPVYTSQMIFEEKLRQAVFSSAGFHLA